MATPHLTSTSATPATSRHLNGNGSHLLVVRKTSAWSNKELVVTPSEENYAAVVAYGDSSYYNQSGHSGITNDGAYVASLADAKMATLTGQSAWHTGKRNIFAYYARKGGPYRFKHLPSSNLDRGMECGMSRVRLKFKCKHIPLGMASAFTAYLRLWCPSWGLGAYENADMLLGTNWAYNGTDTVLYRIGGDDITPASISNGESFSIRSYANEGNLSGTMASGSGTPCDCTFLDCWDREDGYTTSIYNMPRVYLKDASGSAALAEYSSDVAISANALSSLKSSIADTGDVYIGIGAAIANGFGQDGHTLTQAATSTLCIQRVELVFKLTMAKFNA